ncbi:MAG: ribosome silencing factor [Gammaproteobacteria bacterium]|nr:ribosome silencing factor [Gammaproteobacteria bacterium]
MKTEELNKLIVSSLEDLKALNIILLDVRDRSSITDYMVIASGTSNRHVRSLADKVVEKVKAAGIQPLGVEGKGESGWVLVDLVDVVVHIMHPEEREFYSLEKLWAV